MIDRKCILWAALLYLGATLVGLGVVYTGSVFTNQAAGSNSSPYAITLVETMNPTSTQPSSWNSNVPQPSFFILGPSGLESAANISLPVHRLIQLTIMSYDTPTPNSTDDQGKVTGTVGGNVLLMNGTIATMGAMTWRQNVTSVPSAVLAHTFTITKLGINIPVVGGSTVIAYLYFDKAGTYTWICLTPCGLPSSPGDTGAMATSGWMQGQVTVQ